MAAVLQGGKRDRLTSDSAGTPTTPKFTITNFTESFSLDSGSSTNEQIGDVLSTLIQTLIRKGILNGTLAA